MDHFQNIFDIFRNRFQVLVPEETIVSGNPSSPSQIEIEMEPIIQNTSSSTNKRKSNSNCDEKPQNEDNTSHTNPKPLPVEEFKKQYLIHYLCRTGKHLLLQRIISSKKDQLFKKDHFLGRIPLHYCSLAENLENGAKCAKIILEFFEDDVYHLYYEDQLAKKSDGSHSSALDEVDAVSLCDATSQQKLFNLINCRDFEGETSLSLAAKNGNPKLVELLINKGADVQNKTNSGEETLPQIYVNTPSAVLTLLNKSVSFIKSEELQYSIYERKYSLDFTAIVGKYYAEIADSDSIFDFSDDMKNEFSNFKAFQDNFTKIKEKVHKGHPKTEILSKQTSVVEHNENDEQFREMGLLQCVNHKSVLAQKEILYHPLVQYFVKKKWAKMRIFFHISLLFHFIWLAMHSWLIIDVYYSCCQTGGLKETNLSCADYPFENSHFLLEEGSSVTVADKAHSAITQCIRSNNLYWRSFIIICLSTFFLGKELYQFKSLGWAYVKLENIMQLIFMTSIVCTVIVFESIFIIQFQIAAVAVLFASFVFIDILNKLAYWGIYVKVLIKVLKRLLETIPLLLFVMLVMAISLHMLFPDLNPPLESFRNALMTVFMMISGKIDYGKYQKSIDDHYPVTGFLMFTFFYIVMTILLFRILIGFIVSDTKQIQEEEEMRQISTTIEQMYLMESFIFSKRFLKFAKILSAEGFLKKFQIVQGSCSSKLKLILDENEIPQDLINEMRTLASSNEH